MGPGTSPVCAAICVCVCVLSLCFCSHNSSEDEPYATLDNKLNLSHILLSCDSAVAGGSQSDSLVSLQCIKTSVF